MTSSWQCFDSSCWPAPRATQRLCHSPRRFHRRSATRHLRPGVVQLPKRHEREVNQAPEMCNATSGELLASCSHDPNAPVQSNQFKSSIQIEFFGHCAETEWHDCASGTSKLLTTRFSMRRRTPSLSPKSSFTSICTSANGFLSYVQTCSRRDPA